MRTQLGFGGSFHSVRIKLDGGDNDGAVEVGFADLLAFVVVGSGEQTESLAFVNWYEKSDLQDKRLDVLKMPILKRTRQHSPARDFVDLVSLDRILGPAYIQPCPHHKNHFLYNKYPIF